jgi:perosamine synthetase
MIPVNEPIFFGNEKKYLNECIDSGWISSDGPFVSLFEKKLAVYFNRKYAIAVSNGTVAVDLAVESLNLKRGDEVILPSFTIISCIGSILRNGLIPIFVDQEKDTWNMDVSVIEKHVSKRTKAIMIVHIYGLPVDVNPILKIAEKYNLRVIEDAAEVIGQTYYDKKCGSFGDLSTLSFYPNKHITTGEGGMILTDDEDIYNRVKSLRNLCFIESRRFYHIDLGYNARMSNLQAAVGLAQYENLNFNLKRKREIGHKYLNGLKDIKDIRLPLSRTDFAENIFWVFGIVLEGEKQKEYDKIINSLKNEGIGTRPFFWPLHLQPVLKKYNIKSNNLSLPVCEELGSYGFYIPSGLKLSDNQVDYVIKVIKKILS